MSSREQWRDVRGWERLYEVSCWGRVRSIPRRGKHRIYGGDLLKPVKKATGYLCVTLRAPGRDKEQAGIHRLVLEAFVGKPPEGWQACHNNAKRDDNRLENLRWASVADNQADKVLHGNSLRGEKNMMHKLTEEQVRYIRSSDKNQPKLADELGVSQVLISRIRLGKAWKHVR